MKMIFYTPALEDVTRLLKAWRFWVLAATAGALISALIYYIVPPAYRARATVNVDFNLEQAWPQDTDRQQFYYLERETRKLVEIAWSDKVLQVVAENHHIDIRRLRDGRLILSQPAEAGWHFYADDSDSELAAGLASTWAKAFTEEVRAQIDNSEGLNSFIKLDNTQSADLPVKRSVPLSTYLLFGVLISMLFSAFVVLFLHK